MKRDYYINRYEQFDGCLTRTCYVLVLIVVLVLSSCKTRQSIVYVPEVRTDTLIISKAQRDSIWLHDSVYVSEKQSGDTIFVTLRKWHTKYIEKELHDTIYQSRIDSIPVPYPVQEYVEKELSWWQKTKMGAGVIAMLVLLVWVVWKAAMLYLKRF